MAIITTRCEVCGRETEHVEVYEKWGFSILECRACGLGSTRVEASFSSEELYDRDYYQGGRRDGYADYAISEQVLKHEFRRTLARLRRVGPAHGRLLEVGCAFGFFLEEAQLYYECQGIELSEVAVRECRARGLTVHQGEVETEILQRLGTMDAVAMLDCVEHLANPAEVLKRLAAALRPGGSLILTTGDWSSLPARLLGRRWRLMTPPQHLFFFSRSNLSQLLERRGLEVVEHSRPWKWVPLGLIAYQLSRRLGLRKPVPEGLHSMGMPVNLLDTILVVARKP